MPTNCQYLGVVLLAIFYTSIASAHSIKSVINDFDPYVKNSFTTLGVPAVAITIVHNNKIIYMKTLGVRSTTNKQRIDQHTVFRLASVSKSFATTLTGLYVHDGLLHWDDPVNQYLPTFSLANNTASKALTIRHLLSHSSGLPPYAYDNLLEANIPFPEIINRLDEVNAICTVGSCYSYQNVIFSLIGKILERKTGLDYGSLVKQKLFVPLQMHDASTGKNNFIRNINHALPHIKVNGHWTTIGIKQAYYNVLPAGGINASISDLAQWLRVQLGNMPQVVPPAVLTTLTQPAIKTNSELRRTLWKAARLKNAHYGLGWRIYNYAGSNLIYHGGGIKGYRCSIGILPEKNIGIALLANSSSKLLSVIFPKFLDLLLELPEKDWLQTAINTGP